MDFCMLKCCTSTAHGPYFCIARRPVLNMLDVNDIGVMNIHCPYCDALHWLDECVSSSRIGRPEFGMCCMHGKVKLSSLCVPPLPLYNLFTGDTFQAKEF